MSRLALAFLALFPAPAFGQPACPDPDEVPPVPDDFEITHMTGPYGIPMGLERRIRLRTDGSYVIDRRELTPAHPPEPDAWEVVVANRVSDHRVRSVWRAVVACDFFALERDHIDRDVFDGKQSRIRVVAGGRRHTVVVHYRQVPAFGAIRNALYRAIPPAGDWP